MSKKVHPSRRRQSSAGSFSSASKDLAAKPSGASTSAPVTPKDKGTGKAKKPVDKVGETSRTSTQIPKTPPMKKKERPKPPPHPLELLLGEKVKNAGGDEVSPKTFAEREGVLGLYFAAHWCPPCRSFSPMLKMLHDELKKKEQNFEVIFVSFDNSDESFNDYLSKMPWYAIDYDDEDKREEIAFNFGIRGIPVLILLNPQTCDIITLNGRDVVMNDPMGDRFPWDSLLVELEEQRAQQPMLQIHSNQTASGPQGPPPEQETPQTQNPPSVTQEVPAVEAAAGSAPTFPQQKTEPSDKRQSPDKTATSPPKGKSQVQDKTEASAAGNQPQSPEKTEALTEKGESEKEAGSIEQNNATGKNVSKNASPEERIQAPQGVAQKRMSTGSDSSNEKTQAKKKSI